MRTGFGLHLAAGAVSLAFLAFASRGFFGSGVLLAAGAAFIAGSVLPDVDSPYSVPRKLMVGVTFVLAALLSMIFYAQIASACYSAFDSRSCFFAPLLAVSAPFIALMLLDAFVVRHRGFVHSFTAALLYALSVFTLFSIIGIGGLDSAWVAIFGGIGYAVHLCVDFIGDRVRI